MQPLIGGGGSLVNNNNNNNNTSLANNNNIAVSKTGLYHGKKCCEVLFVEIIHGFLSLSLPDELSEESVLHCMQNEA